MSLRTRTTTRTLQNTRQLQPGTIKPATQMHNEDSGLFEPDDEQARLRKKSGHVTPQDVLQLQRTMGNQAVMRMLVQRQPVRRDDDDNDNPTPGGEDANSNDQGSDQNQQDQQPPQLTLEDEQKIIRAKRAGVVQRAWTGRRQLGHGNLNSILGKPWVWSKSGNWFNLGLYHEHIFFEDGGAPPDIGHMGKQGLGSDTVRVGEYAKEYKNLDDAKMRQAVELNKYRGEAGKYTLLENNCQKFVTRVLDSYWKLVDEDGSSWITELDLIQYRWDIPRQDINGKWGRLQMAEKSGA